MDPRGASKWKLHLHRTKVCAARREWHTFYFWLEKKNVVLYKNVCVCAVELARKKKNKDLGCAVLYLSVFPCTHRNIEGILLF